ncbi:hypothetical protein HYV43_05755 [Candidatus Micrarchaeota archaeon]|nr:hypothetical protein [Candidatus Micrarchaeota archaeon]
MASNIGKDLTHLVVLAVLVVVLLVVLTKFQWVHCSVIPGWCNVYCNVITRSHAQVGLIYGPPGDGMGNPVADDLEARGSFENEIRALRPDIALLPISKDDLSAGLLKRYDVIILERARSLSSRQIKVLIDFVEKGGTLVFVGDSATSQYVDPYDLLLAQQENQTYYERLQRELNARNLTWDSNYANRSIEEYKKTDTYDTIQNYSKVKRGFRKLVAVTAAEYNRTITRGYFVNLSIALPDHLVAKGLLKKLTDTQIREYAIVSVDPASTDIIAYIEDGKNRYPGIIETRYAGKVIYFAYPPERTNSATLLANTWDYIAQCSQDAFPPSRNEPLEVAPAEDIPVTASAG